LASPTGNPIGEYRKQAVTGASPLELVLMLYDGALQSCALAKKAIEDRDLEAQHKHLLRAQRVLSELTASLDMESGGEVARNLFGLYTYCLNQLAEANVRDEVEPLERTAKVLSELRVAWQQIREVAGAA
jgi:flagellar protein FliS